MEILHARLGLKTKTNGIDIDQKFGASILRKHRNLWFK